MFSKKIKILQIIILIFTLNNGAWANQQTIKKSVEYFNNLKFFSASFVQNDNNSLSEGKIYIESQRIRVEYTSPSKILIILAEDKAMYYNYDLDEDEFFDPKKTSAWFFYDIFNDSSFFLESKIVTNDDYIILEKNGYNQKIQYEIKIYFENKPFILRKIDLVTENTNLVISFYDHKYNETFDEKFFKLINPSLIN